jgi:phosphoenolpyruvate mutase
MLKKDIIPNSTRVGLLRKLIKEKGCLRIIEVHNGISGIIANNTQVIKNGLVLSFDGFWESSLTDSASKGLPDIELVTSDSRLHSIYQIIDVTSKPIIVDGDTGGDINQFEHLVRRLERAGVSMVIIEDKTFPKRNSLTDSMQQLENIDVFSRKIKRGVNAKYDKDFLVIARLESLIAGESIEEALIRAEEFLKSGADGIMIHSKSASPSEILEFAKRYHQLPIALIHDKILVCAPTTYNTISTKELGEAGFQIVIYANHLLRSAYMAMENTAKTILTYDRALEAESICVPIKELFQTVGMLDIVEKDKDNL